MEREFKVTRSFGAGLACMWEEGGGMKNRGNSVILALPDGTKPKAIFIARKGNLACSQHALVPINKGMYIIIAKHHNEEFEIQIYRIFIIDVDEEIATAELMYMFKDNEWDEDFGSAEQRAFEDALNAARDKATKYHCSEPMFVNYMIKPEYSNSEKEAMRNDGSNLEIRKDDYSFNVILTTDDIDDCLKRIGYQKIRDTHRETFFATMKDKLQEQMRKYIDKPEKIAKKGDL